MAKFLTAADTSAAIERVIREAERELVLISAYVFPRFIYLDRLRDAAARGVKITLVFGKRSMDAKVRAQFERVDNIRIYFLHELHAKCYCNEKHAVVTSLNLLNSSEAQNREMGVRLDRATDAEAYNDCLAEVRSILQASELVYASSDEEAQPLSTVVEPFPKVGYCIRCGNEQGCNPDAPLCVEDFKVWVRHQDPNFPERRCHTCGERGTVSMARPLCSKCGHRYGAALAQLDAERKSSGLLGWRTWRVQT